MAEKLFKKLPEILQTTANKNFFDSTVEQLFSPANVEVINGYIGTQKSEDYKNRAIPTGLRGLVPNYAAIGSRPSRVVKATKNSTKP